MTMLATTQLLPHLRFVTHSGPVSPSSVIFTDISQTSIGFTPNLPRPDVFDKPVKVAASCWRASRRADAVPSAKKYRDCRTRFRFVCMLCGPQGNAPRLFTRRRHRFETDAATHVADDILHRYLIDANSVRAHSGRVSRRASDPRSGRRRWMGVERWVRSGVSWDRAAGRW